jgi:hypothetical protein
VDRKSAAWRSNVVRDVSSTQSSAADRVIFLSFELVSNPPAFTNRTLTGNLSVLPERIRVSISSGYCPRKSETTRLVHQWVTFMGGWTADRE